MKQFRAIIFDIYQTLLEDGPGPPNAEARWQTLWKEKLKAVARLSLADFAVACDQPIAREHTSARELGIDYPEIYWPAVACEVLPELGRLPESNLAEFLFQHAQLSHTIRLFPYAAELLSSLSKMEVLLGLASNCQPHTLRELDTALGSVGLPFSIFKPELCFFSFTHGFAKPNPHVFRSLFARLRKLRISPAETLMVGDRLDNDIYPARAQGFCAWQLTRLPMDKGQQSGDWNQLAIYLNVAMVKSGQR